MSGKMDLIIVNDDGVFRVAQNTWMQEKNRIAADVVGDAAVLVKRGALIADVPEPNIPVGFYCFLVNLAQLSDATEVPDQKPNPNPVPLGDNGILVHALPDAYYTVPEGMWRENKVGDPLGPPENQVICSETDKGFVVNLPRIRKK